jgi:hypothetical protein
MPSDPKTVEAVARATAERRWRVAGMCAPKWEDLASSPARAELLAEAGALIDALVALGWRPLNEFERELLNVAKDFPTGSGAKERLATAALNVARNAESRITGEGRTG